MKHIVIIGNGISGVTAARHIRKQSDHQITIISAESKYFFSRTALMYVYMGHMKFDHIQPYEPHFWKKNRIDLVEGRVQKVNTDQKKLVMDAGNDISYDQLILAVGSKPNKFGWPGQDLKGVGGMYSKQDLENIEMYTKNIKRGVIVGGGLIGIELAEMLHARNIPVTFLVREASFWSNVLPAGESALVTRHIKKNHIDLRLKTELKEIVSDENGRVKEIITGDGETIECGFVGLTAGVTPNIDFLRDGTIELGRGIKVNEYLETNIKDVFAIGDCAEHLTPVGLRRPLEQVWYTGRIMGETIARTICDNPTKYQPGHWFNSAKFFEIEYQTYGWVWAHPKENESQFYWEHENGEICVRLAFDTQTHKFLGINTFGIRMRHEIFDKWLTEKQSIEHVLEHLKDANFDPEFYSQYENAIVGKFNQEFKTQIKAKQKSWKRIFNISK